MKINKNGFSVLVIVILLGVIAIVAVTIFSISKGKDNINNLDLIGGKTTVGQERKFVSLGASYTKANNLSSNLVGDNPEYSFAAGTKIESIYLYLKKMGENLAPVNLAESGANSKDVLQKQLPNALSYHPKYLTIDITADIFEDSSPGNLETNLKEIVSQFKDEDTTILISSYPNLALLRSASYPACKQDKLGVGINKVSVEKIQTFNQAIKDFALKNNNVIFVDLYSVLGPSDVSDYDCIHPNIEGQKKLAKVWIEALEKGR